MNPPSSPSFLLLLLVRRGRITTPPTKPIPPRMPDGVAGSSHPPVPNSPATFDLPGLAVSNRGGLASEEDYHLVPSASGLPFRDPTVFR